MFAILQVVHLGTVPTTDQVGVPIPPGCDEGHAPSRPFQEGVEPYGRSVNEKVHIGEVSTRLLDRVQYTFDQIFRSAQNLGDLGSGLRLHHEICERAADINRNPISH